MGPGRGGARAAATRRPPPGRRRRRTGDPTITLVGALFLVILVVGGASALAAPGAQAGQVVPLLVNSALYLAAGLIAWRRRPHNRIGVLMVLTGLSIWLTILVHVPDRFLSTVGIIGATLPLALTLHLLLAFLSGRVRGQFPRVLVAGGYAASTVLQLPVVMIGTGPAAVWNPPNAATLVGAASAVQTVVGVSSVVASAVFVAVRASRADPVERRLLGPMVWYRVLLPVVIGVGHWPRGWATRRCSRPPPCCSSSVCWACRSSS